MPVARLAGDLDAVDRAENALQVPARGRLVVDDENAQAILLGHGLLLRALRSNAALLPFRRAPLS